MFTMAMEIYIVGQIDPIIYPTNLICNINEVSMCI